MHMEQFIEELYSNTVNELLNGIPDEYKEKVSNGYKEHLKAVYGNLRIVEGKYEQALKEETEDYMKKFASLMPFSKLTLYARDENMEELCKLAGEAFELAIHKDEVKDTLDKDEIAAKIRRMEELYEKVEFYNKLAAQTTLSEGTLEYNYALGNSDLMSMRSSHYIRR